MTRARLKMGSKNKREEEVMHWKRVQMVILNQGLRHTKCQPYKSFSCIH